jgi:hypothetical protein
MWETGVECVRFTECNLGLFPDEVERISAVLHFNLTNRTGGFMNLETMSQMGEFVGGFGVILSLVYLAIQVRSNTNSQRADMTARILDRMAAMQHTYAFDAEASKFFTRAITNPTGLTLDERNQFAWLMTEFLSAMEFLMQQYQTGNVDEQTWRRWSNTLDWWLTFPGIRAFWTGRPTPYTDAFSKYVEERLINGKGDYNQDNWNSYLLTGQASSGS